MEERRHMTAAIVLIIIGVLWYAHAFRPVAAALGALVPLIIGAFLLYLWYSHRQGEGKASPWLLGVGLLLILDTVDGWFGFDVRFTPTLFIVVGVVLLLDRKAAWKSAEGAARGLRIRPRVPADSRRKARHGTVISTAPLSRL